MNYFSVCLFLLSIVILGCTSCNNGPKVIAAPVEATMQASTGIFADDEASPRAEHNTSDVHSVIVKEVLPTERYVYVRVIEGEDEFWIATAKQEIKVGGHYFYNGGLLKTNFESKEYNRMFEKIYLVSRIVPSNHGMDQSNMDKESSTITPDPVAKEDEDRKSLKATITIAELVDNMNSYEGTKVQISGTCTKINPNIMGRNWIHLKDGTKDDYDLVITSNILVQEGSTVTMIGTVSLDRDFGAGYRYELILENGILVQ